jgi:hypothetical protein
MLWDDTATYRHIALLLCRGVFQDAAQGVVLLTSRRCCAARSQEQGDRDRMQFALRDCIASLFIGVSWRICS